MKLFGACQLQLFFEDGSEKYIFQNSSKSPRNEYDFSCYNRESQNHDYVKVTKPNVDIPWWMTVTSSDYAVSSAVTFLGNLSATTSRRDAEAQRTTTRAFDPRPYQPVRNHVAEMSSAVRANRSELDRREAQRELSRRDAEAQRITPRNSWTRFTNMFRD